LLGDNEFLLIRPTTMFVKTMFDMTLGLTETPEQYIVKPTYNNGIWQILYSIHSSLVEIKSFVESLKPVTIDAIGVGGANQPDDIHSLLQNEFCNYSLKNGTKVTTISKATIQSSDHIEFVDYIDTPKTSSTVTVKVQKQESQEESSCDYDPDLLLSQFSTQDSDSEDAVINSKKRSLPVDYESNNSRPIKKSCISEH
jgi:hypothetical protein